jgi:hypothetical protein
MDTTLLALHDCSSGGFETPRTGFDPGCTKAIGIIAYLEWIKLYYFDIVNEELGISAAWPSPSNSLFAADLIEICRSAATRVESAALGSRRAD